MSPFIPWGLHGCVGTAGECMVNTYETRVIVVGLAAWFLMLPVAGRADGRWYEYGGCRLIHGEEHDGDSFHVRTKSREIIVRLYFVDTPEMDASLEERVKEQAEYWGVSVEDVLKLGKAADRFTEAFLAGRFNVFSKLEDARGRSKSKRFYGIVEKDGKALAEALVENGLARVFGMFTDLPDGKASDKYIAELRVLERKARRAKRGAWGVQRKDSIFALPEIESRDLTLTAAVSVYSLDAEPRFVATLPRGTVVRVLAAQTFFNVRLSYRDAAGAEQQVQCARSSLGL